MRYYVVAPKIYYYLSLIIFSGGVLMFTYLTPKALLANELIAFFILLTFGSIWFLFLLFVILNKLIYLKLDLKERSVIYGNLFFQQEVPFDKVTELKRKGWITNELSTIKILNKHYTLITPHNNLGKARKIITGQTDWTN